MVNYKTLYLKFLNFQNNLIINFFIILNQIFPNQFKDKLLYYKIKKEEYYKYLLLLSINDRINEKYHIDLLSIGMNLYDKYKTIIAKNDDISDMSDIEDMSDIDD